MPKSFEQFQTFDLYIDERAKLMKAVFATDDSLSRKVNITTKNNRPGIYLYGALIHVGIKKDENKKLDSSVFPFLVSLKEHDNTVQFSYAELLGIKPAKKENSLDEPLMDEAVEYLSQSGKKTISALQRRFRIGYNRAARMMEEIDAEHGSHAR